LKPFEDDDLLKDPDDNGSLDDPIPTSNALLPMLIILVGFATMITGIYALLT